MGDFVVQASCLQYSLRVFRVWAVQLRFLPRRSGEDGRELKIEVHPGSAYRMRKRYSIHSKIRADTKVHPNKNSLTQALSRRKRGLGVELLSHTDERAIVLSR